MTHQRIDPEDFEQWCERQTQESVSATARNMGEVGSNREMYRCRIREGRDVGTDRRGTGYEDVILIKGSESDTVKFERQESATYHTHRKDVEFHEKTVKVKDDRGKTVASAGTGTAKRKGPFPF